MAEHEPSVSIDIPDESDDSRSILDADAIDFEFAPARQDRLDVVAPIEEAKLAPNPEEPLPGVAPDTDLDQPRPDQIGREAESDATDTTLDNVGDRNIRSFAREPSAGSTETDVASDKVFEAANSPSEAVNEPMSANLGKFSGELNHQTDALVEATARLSVGAETNDPASSASSPSNLDSFETGEASTPNVAPTDILVSGGTVDENSGSGTVVATLNAVDENVADTFTYTITDDASGAFEVVGNEIRVKAGADLDYETAQTHDITVQVTDAGGLTYSETFTIAVNDVNEAPVDLMVRGGAIAENAAQGTVVATVSGVDEDANETFTYTLVDDADGRFAIDDATGEIAVADPLGLDFEAQPTHTLSVRVTDSAGNSHVDAVTVTLSDVAGERVLGDGRDNVILGDVGNDFLQGGDGADTLSGGAGTDWLYGQNGDDRVSGGDGNDYIIDQSGSDHLQGGAGNDYILDLDYNDDGRDTLEGGEGNDLLLSGGGSDVVDGGEGTDTLYYSTSTEGVRVTLGEAGETTVGVGGTADGDQITNVENVLASRFDDSVTGNSESNTIYGYAGDDVIDGGAGNDTLYGDYGYASSYYSGDDTIIGGAGDDIIDGGAGNDLFIYAVGDGNDTIRGGAGENWVDTIELRVGADGAALGDYGTEWTVHLTSGSIVAQDAHSISLSDDADGTISLSDGSEIDFWDLEQINF